MLQARDKGELLRGEADFQLHLVYLWYEKQDRPRRLDAARAARRALPAQPAVPPAHRRNPRRLPARSRRQRRRMAMLLARAGRHGDSRERPKSARVWTRVGLAMNRTRSDRELQRVVDMRPIEPIGARERAERELRAAIARIATSAIAAAATFFDFLCTLCLTLVVSRP